MHRAGREGRRGLAQVYRRFAYYRRAMDDGEFLALVVGLFASASVASGWLRLLVRPPRFGRANPAAWVVGAGALGTTIAAAAIAVGGDPQVRGDAGYWLLFLLPVPAILALAGMALPFMGISLRADVLESGNGAALPVALAHLLGAAILYAASNIGRGDTIGTTFETAAYALAAFCGIAIMTAVLYGVPRSVALERDTAAGNRFAAWLLAIAAPIAYASSGDWVSRAATLHDVARGAAVSCAIAAAGIAVERIIPWTRVATR
jgi:hypothetical protein